MVLNAAWPLIANAKPAVPASPVEICSAAGLNHAAGGAPVDSPKSVHPAHCSLCSFHAERGLAIVNAGQPLVISEPPGAEVFSRGDAPGPEIALYPTAPPRAPPFLF
jgi:hypothetical protein